MQYSSEELQAFWTAAELGSFSAAARKLKKNQSTISTAIANLEADLGLTLFDRSARYPALTAAGQKVLGYVEAILTANEHLEALSIRLTAKTEAKLTLVFSDTYQFNQDKQLIKAFEQRYQDIEMQWMVAEGDDVLELVSTGRAHIGMLASQAEYPPDIAAARLPEQTHMGIFVSKNHPLTKVTQLAHAHLNSNRRLYLNTYSDKGKIPQGRVWSAPNYLLLLEMAEQGFGWAELPYALVNLYGLNKLTELKGCGWPKPISVDVIWSKSAMPGPAGLWFIDGLLEMPIKD